MKIKVIYVLFLFLFFFSGIILEYAKPNPYYKFREFIKNFKLSEDKVLLSSIDYKICTLDDVDIEYVQKQDSKNLTLITGHIYTLNKNDFLLKNFENIVLNNNLKFENVIFLGDIFDVPTIKKWKLFSNFVKKFSLNYYIAPGNHDVGIGENSKRDIFFQFNYELPLFINNKDFDIIILDSTKKQFSLTNAQIKFIQNSINFSDKKNNLFIATHHLLRPLSINIANEFNNSKNNILEILKKDLNNISSKYNNVYFLAGDLGLNKNFDCINNKNIHFISTGLSGEENDSILIFNKLTNKINKINIPNI